MADFTKKAIMQTFIALLNEKPFHKITVKDIVEKCGINRNTFYYHFEDIYDLLEQILYDEIEKFRINHMTYENWKDITLDSMRFLIQNKKATLHLFHSIGQKELDKYLKTTFSLALTEYMIPLFKKYEVTEKDQFFLLTFYTNALVGIALEWIRNDLDEDYVMTFLDLTDQWFHGFIEKTISEHYCD